MGGVEYHIHVNHFEKNAPGCLSELVHLGFRVTEACLIRNNRKSPLWLIARKVNSSTDRDDCYNAALSVIKADHSFRGYIESETIACSNVTQFAAVPSYDCLLSPAPFPISQIHFSPHLKVADIHVYRHKKDNLDELDSSLENNGFYLVQTAKKNIWTLLASDIRHVQTLYSQFKTYFEAVGEVLELELEIINALQIVPSAYSLPEYIRAVTFELRSPKMPARHPLTVQQ